MRISCGKKEQMMTENADETMTWADEIVGEILLKPEEIAAIVQRLGDEITRDYRGKNLVVVGILRGAALFMADLVRAIRLPLEMDFISVSSYGQMTKSSGVVQIIKDLSSPIAGKDILLVEDVVDSGLTWNYLKQILVARDPASVKMCSLLDKPSTRKIDVTVDYLGVSIEDKFVVGYGLDWKEKYRNLPFVMVPK
jgi:hypoxanthine phosphoribosyltransferase